jgi:hypothetical protein
VNPVLRALLRSPAHGLLSKRFVLLMVTGRRTGREYVIPVGRHESEGELVVCASGRWRHNLRGGAQVRLTIDGQERAGHATFEDDPPAVAQVYRTLLDRLGPDNARLLGLKLNVDRLPTVEELTPVVAGQRAIVRVRLADD